MPYAGSSPGVSAALLPALLTDQEPDSSLKLREGADKAALAAAHLNQTRWGRCDDNGATAPIMSRLRRRRSCTALTYWSSRCQRPQAMNQPVAEMESLPALFSLGSFPVHSSAIAQRVQISAPAMRSSAPTSFLQSMASARGTRAARPAARSLCPPGGTAAEP